MIAYQHLKLGTQIFGHLIGEFYSFILIWQIKNKIRPTYPFFSEKNYGKQDIFVWCLMPGFHRNTADRRTPSICRDDSAVQTVMTRPPPGVTGVAEVDDPSGSVVEILKNRPSRKHRRVRPTAQPGPSHMQVKNQGILTPETAHTARQCMEHPHPKPHSHLPAAATRPHQPEERCSLVEAENGQAKAKTTNTLPSPAAAWARETMPTV